MTATPADRPDGSAPKMSMGAFTETTGLRLTLVSSTRVEGHLDVGPALYQPDGIVHGGVWATVVETVASIGAAVSAAEHGQLVVGVHNSTDFLRQMSDGRASVVAEPLRQGRTQQLWDVRIRDGDGRLVAVGRVRLHHIEGRPG
jgi:1,4-dihydroxy-2-naphthoyl-CoA hydrolase